MARKYAIYDQQATYLVRISVSCTSQGISGGSVWATP